ncbi:MAG: 5'/3'-nucleotidase SurE [Candidatus Aminicenantes bacterium RBG_16_63_16]|nr:MAG: 5'/3'-nucleotidase SurE [Candidatus Aminicenantes bacterium RBG_16_63_16]
MPLVLLTNDDGYFSEGIRALARRLGRSAEVVVVAPDREKSAASLALTLRRPLRVEKISRRTFAVDGTPADCVYLAVAKLLPRPPDLLVSGINHGPNVGRQDTAYSGTVSGAVQGTFLGIPSIAASLLADFKKHFSFDSAGDFTARLALAVLRTGLPPGVTLNVNIPPGPVKGIELTELGEKRYEPEVVEKKDPRDRTYYWIGLAKISPSGGRRSDVRAVERGSVSITPIHTDRTDRRALASAALRKILQGLA